MGMPRKPLSPEEKLRREKQEAVAIAKDLYYPETIIRRIRLAKSSLEIDRIMADGRKML